MYVTLSDSIKGQEDQLMTPFRLLRLLSASSVTINQVSLQVSGRVGSAVLLCRVFDTQCVKGLAHGILKQADLICVLVYTQILSKMINILPNVPKYIFVSYFSKKAPKIPCISHSVT